MVQSAKEKPIAGTVVRVGPGRLDPEGDGVQRKTPSVAEGDQVSQLWESLVA